MDPISPGVATGAAMVGAAFIKGLDKIPWGKIFGRNGNGNSNGVITKDAVRAIIAEHQTGCTTGIYAKIDSVKSDLRADIKSLESTIVNMLLQDRGKS